MNKTTKKTFIYMSSYGCYLVLDDIIILSKDNNGPYIMVKNSNLKYRIKECYYNYIEKLLREHFKVIDI